MEYLCVKEESILLQRIKPHALYTILEQIHGYIDTDYSCQRNDQISPKFQILVVQMISIGHENNCGLIHEQKVLFQRC